MPRFKNILSATKYNICFVTILAFIFISCGKSLPTLDGLDLKVWKEDENACGGKRTKMQEALLSQRDKLLALDELQIVELLGKPDQNELYKRNQKFYYYYLQPASVCNPAGAPAPKRLAIRFNAMGLAKEITIE